MLTLECLLTRDKANPDRCKPIPGEPDLGLDQYDLWTLSARGHLGKQYGEWNSFHYPQHPDEEEVRSDHIVGLCASGVKHHFGRQVLRPGQGPIRVQIQIHDLGKA